MSCHVITFGRLIHRFARPLWGGALIAGPAALAQTGAAGSTPPWHALALGSAYALGASLLAYALLRGLFWLRRRVVAALDRRLLRWRAEHPERSVIGTYSEHAHTGTRAAATALTWGLTLLLLDLWFSFVLQQFALTRPWGERSSQWLLDVLGRFALAAVGAVPGLLTAVLIFFIARLATRANTAFMSRVEHGELQVSWLDADIAAPTRRLSNVVIWLFALAMAYPYLPGAESEAFKGVTVLAGLMLSLGASGVVGQAMAGLSLMYARALRVGEYVKIGDTEGTVTSIGLFATKLHTGLGVEVSLPSASLITQPVRNFSRLVDNGQFMLHAAVTIGYATPWRQVHTMMLEAARRTPGVADSPVPFVVQTALSDFYVEYRLCAQGNKSAPRRRVEAISALHANIQDVFNENGVQIMSPHYRSDPAQPQVVAPADWAPPLVHRPPTPPHEELRPGG
ncbi:MAG: mechanosensitive ion channel [Rubrivivax sp.]|nr:mechanosensitive ion channel [Rubrivivax sp.]